MLPMLLVLGLCLSFILPFAVQGKSNEIVYFIPIEKEVEMGLAKFIDRSIEEAEAAGAAHIVFEMHTPGGSVQAATEIAKRLKNTSTPTTAYINKEAISAGAYLALNADYIVMVPGATMGAAAVIDQQGNAAGEKAESFWRAEMEGAAQSHGVDPIYAVAMADKSVDLPEYNAGEGKLLTLTSAQAKEVGYADEVVETRAELLDFLELSGATIEETEVSFAEHLARFITNPIVVPILLSIASLGLIMELYTPGFGLPGTMGLSALVLFFYGHMVAGLAGMETAILLIAGIVLIVLELFVPGGILGIAGVAAIVVSLILSGSSVGGMLMSILIAFIVTVIASIILFKYFGYENGIFRRIILFDSTSTDKGYVSNENRTDLLNKEGVTLTPLRPAGTVIIGDDRVDVVTEGSFIGINEKVKVIQTTGARIVVRRLEKEE
ncbi:NfeD family protein [Bacillus solimangrovi]|uniref:Uncharacterized protein n=1 Tax=Bacillus solimangrovi TaxID=1305675 RepID=A0A1E5LI43_9BACI|nr:hypothetical protein BFG57_11705 [Bacillus solimangrovi]